MREPLQLSFSKWFTAEELRGVSEELFVSILGSSVSSIDGAETGLEDLDIYVKVLDLDVDNEDVALDDRTVTAPSPSSSSTQTSMNGFDLRVVTVVSYLWGPVRMDCSFLEPGGDRWKKMTSLWFYG